MTRTAPSPTERSAPDPTQRSAADQPRLWSLPGVRTGLLGALLLAVAGWLAAPILAPLDGSSPIAGVPVIGWFRTTHLGEAGATVVFFAGMVALLVGWVRLGAVLRAGAAGLPVRNLPVGTLWRVGALWSAPLLVVPPLGSRDVYSYLAQGHLAALGVDPYLYGPSAAPGGLLDAVGRTWWYTPSPYGPGFTALAGWASELTGGHLVSGFVALRLLAVLGVLATALLVRWVAAAVGADPALATWLAVLNPLVLLHLVAGAHSEAVLVPFLLAAVGLAVTGRPLRAAAALGLAAAVKVTVVVALPFLVVLWLVQRPVRRRRDLPLGLLVTGAVTAGVLTVVSCAGGFGFGWIAGARGSALHGSRLSLTTTVSDAAHFLGVHAGDDALGLAVGAAVRTLGLLVAVGLVLRLLRPGADLQRVVLRCGTALLVVALLSPILHPWYLLPGLAVLAVARPGPRAVTFAVRLTVVFALLLRPGGGEVLHHYAPFALLSAAVALAVSLVLTARQDRLLTSAPHTLQTSAPAEK